MAGRAAGGAAVSYGGMKEQPANGSTDWIEFPTHAGADLPYIGVALVTVADPASLTGCFLKIGSDANGVGYGAGATTFDDTGSAIILLKEGIAWAPGAANAFVAGLNVLVFAVTNESLVVVTNINTGLAASSGSSDVISPSSLLRINGYSTNRGSNAQVNAIAVFNKSLTGAQYNVERDRLGAEAMTLRAPSKHATRTLFMPAVRRTVFSVTVQILRPISDTVAGAWTPSTGTLLYAMLDEVGADDADYITVASASTTDIAFAAGSAPTAGSQNARFRAKRGGTGVLTYSVMEGASVRGTLTPTLTSVFQTFTVPVSGVVSYTALFQRITVTAS